MLPFSIGVDGIDVFLEGPCVIDTIRGGMLFFVVNFDVDLVSNCKVGGGVDPLVCKDAKGDSVSDVRLAFSSCVDDGVLEAKLPVSMSSSVFSRTNVGVLEEILADCAVLPPDTAGCDEFSGAFTGGDDSDEVVRFVVIDCANVASGDRWTSLVIVNVDCEDCVCLVDDCDNAICVTATVDVDCNGSRSCVVVSISGCQDVSPTALLEIMD